MSDYSDELLAYTEGERDRGDEYGNPYGSGTLHGHYDDGFMGHVFEPESERT